MKTTLGNKVKELLGDYGIEYNTNGTYESCTSLMLNHYMACEDGMTMETFAGVIYSEDDDFVAMNFSKWETDDEVINSVKEFLAEHDLLLIFGKNDVRLNDRKTGITIDKETVRWSSEGDIEWFVSDDDHEVYVFNHNFD